MLRGSTSPVDDVNTHAGSLHSNVLRHPVCSNLFAHTAVVLSLDLVRERAPCRAEHVGQNIKTSTYKALDRLLGAGHD